MVSIFFKNLLLLKGGEWQALQCFTSPDSYTCKERSCFFLFSFLRSCDPDSDMLRRTLSSPTSPGGHPPCLLSRGREEEEEAQKESSVTKGDCSYEEGRRIASTETKKNELNKTKQRKTNLHRKRREVAGGNIEEKDLMT